MIQANNVGNGCTLEDCHTNLFALTDLSGIKWRKLCSSDSSYCVEPLEDPVLLSFTRCIQSDILCVWRRVPRNSADGAPAVQLTCHKELWVFWYGDEPHHLPSLLAPELHEKDSGSWDLGLTYECRTLLFKALHNLIERCLMSQGFVRIGKWFVQPYPHYNHNACGIIDKSSHLSISFSFFLHGESTVCASIDVREHPPLRNLHPQHLAIAAQTPMPVILGPYGISATLTGQSYKETDHSTQKLLDEWRQFYVLPNWDNVDGISYLESHPVPPCVEVVVAGMRLKYPSCFVLMLAEKETEFLHQHRSVPSSTASSHMPTTPSQAVISNISLTSPHSPCAVLTGDSPTKASDTPISDYLFTPTLVPGLDPKVRRETGKRIIEKAWQDATISGASLSRYQQADNSTVPPTEEQPLSWQFGEPMSKNSCICPRTRGGKSRSAGSGTNKPGLPNTTSKHIKNEKGEKSDRDKLRRNATPFHRRTTQNDLRFQQDIDHMIQRLPPSQLGTTKASGVGHSIPQLPVRGNTASHVDNSVDSPHSAAPSPLNISQNQPSVTQNGDPTMPTLSPHPPPKIEKDLNTSTSLHGDTHESGPAAQMNGTSGVNASNGAVHAGLATMNSNSSSIVPASAMNFSNVAQQLTTVKSEQIGIGQSHNTVNGLDHIKVDGVNTWLDSQKERHVNSHCIKRPVLPSNGYQDDEEELKITALYNFENINSYLDQPIKKSRLDLDDFARRPGPQPPNSLPSVQKRTRSPPQPKPDPYEFSEDSSSDPGHLPCRRRSTSSPFGMKQDDDYGRNNDSYPALSSLDLSPETPGTVGGLPVSLTREEDLKPKMDDLNNMFDTDSESSDPDILPHTMNHLGGPEDSSRTITSRPGNCTNIIVPVTNISELTKMYPTPPSQEPQHTLSPGNMMELATEQTILDMTTTKHETYSLLYEEHRSMIQDWTFVYKPPTSSMYVGSSKYAPIELASSHLEPLIIPPELHYKPSWHQYQHMPIMDKTPHPTNSSHYPNLPSVENIGSVGSKPTDRMNSIETSPATFGPNSAQQRTPRTPMSYELPSPASNASSYMRNINSVDNHPTNSQRPESHSLVVNVMLSDSIFNLFKDHNFDSCPMCVCNMNIKGTDMINYILDKSPEPQYPCTCGFSAVVNRRYGSNCGLFYEDEVDITGIRSERLERRKPALAYLLNQDNKDMKDKTDCGEVIPHEVLTLLQGHFASLHPTCITQLRGDNRKPTTRIELLNSIELQDGCEACMSALEVGRQASDNCSTQRYDDSLLRSSQILHKWPYLQSAKTPINSQDVVRLLKSLQPLLQDAIQKKRTTRLWESVYTILGPLSWKDFHLLAGRGSKETSEPQPVPPLLVGSDKDWMSLSPFSLKYWDKITLEPYGKPRDMAYVVIAPDNKYVLSHVRTFFQELSRIYESQHLGKHRQFTKTLSDSIMRISQKYYSNVANENVSEWFANLGNSNLAAKLRQYTQVCIKYLAPFLANLNLDKSIFEDPTIRQSASRLPAAEVNSQSQPTQAYQSSMSNSSNTYSQGGTPNSFGLHGSGSTNMLAPDAASQTQTNSEENKENENVGGTKEQDGECDAQLPGLIIYMVDPFTYSQEGEDMTRLSTLGLLRCFQEMLKVLPEQLQQCTQLQIIPQQMIIDRRGPSMVDEMKNLCLTVYSQSRRPLTHSVPGRSLTGFGPAAAAEKVLKDKGEYHVSNVHLYTPPYILGNTRMPSRMIQPDRQEHSAVMFCGYCLSEDQRWLLAVCTDNCGEIMEPCVINVEIPSRNRRKKASARRIGLQKLWEFIIGVVSQTCLTWRLVIGSLGRLGHGELKGWACLLNKMNLSRTNARLKEICRQCSLSLPTEIPCIISACLVSMEVHPTLHITPNSLKMEERRSSKLPLSTPQDASCTHILVFPTSARAQATQENAQDAHTDGNMTADLDMGDDILKGDFLGVGGVDDDMMGLGGIDEILGGIGMGISDTGISPHSNPGSPTHVDVNGRSSHLPSDSHRNSTIDQMHLQEEDIHQLSQTLLQQPLAMGFYVSTAKTGPLPQWFWGPSSHREDVCPNIFKAALHIHCQQNHDEFDHHQGSQKHTHPLDSNLTCDVLRYVLETYNALSWLTMDPATNDRRSCLPAHYVVLLQLYHAMNNLV